jgi:cytochrome d ubiquinol oxidase subunit II
MVDLWFVLVCAMFAAYVVLDGYDLGTGIVSPIVAKTDAERRAVLHTILPFWDGNEVFLVAGGATLYLAFPRLFPAFVSGFYLPVMIVLWLLILRGLGIEMRHKLDLPLWNELWDGAFFLSSLLLVIVFGAALGNVVRGVSIDESGDFFAPLWTNFRVEREVGILDWYTVLVGLTALVLISRHGALRLAASTSEDHEAAIFLRSRDLARRLAPVGILAAIATTIATFFVQPNALANVRAHAWVALFPGVAVVAMAFSARCASTNRPKQAFQASSATLVGLFGSACASVHPYGLLARDPARSVLATDAAASPYALGVGLAWWLPGMAIVVTYSIVAHRRLLHRGP